MLLPPPLYLALEVGDFPAQAIAAWDGMRRGRAFAVVDQDPENHKTFVIACSRAARECGAAAGMPFAAVRRRFRHVTPVFRNLAWEAALSEELRALCLRYTPLLDMTGTPAARALKPQALAAKFRRDARFSAGLEDAAVGAAGTRLMAKVMARQALDAGKEIAFCPPGEEAEMLSPLPPACLPGLSPQCRERIRRYALDSVGRIRGLGRAALAARFGGEGDRLYTLSCGLDLEETRAAATAGGAPCGVATPGGVVAETALEEDLNDEDALDRQVRLTADKLVFRLRKAGLQADALTLSILYADGKAVRKTSAVRPRTGDFRTLAGKARELFRILYQRRVALRSIALTAPAPKRDTGQTDLFESQGDRRQQALGDALAKIRDRCGFNAVLSGANVRRETQE
jgi:DNA polymerase-4